MRKEKLQKKLKKCKRVKKYFRENIALLAKEVREQKEIIRNHQIGICIERDKLQAKYEKLLVK